MLEITLFRTALLFFCIFILFNILDTNMLDNMNCVGNITHVDEEEVCFRHVRIFYSTQIRKNQYVL